MQGKNKQESMHTFPFSANGKIEYVYSSWKIRAPRSYSVFEN